MIISWIEKRPGRPAGGCRGLRAVSGLRLKGWRVDLNQLYRNEPTLHEQDFIPAGFEWIDWYDALPSTLGMMRKASSAGGVVIGVFNFRPVAHHNYRVGAPMDGFWREALNSTAQGYGSSGIFRESGKVRKSRPRTVFLAVQ